MSMDTPSVSKLARLATFTPKRPLSVASGSDLATPSVTNTTKKYKAALSTESRIRAAKAPAHAALSPVPGTPTKDGSRPKTPSTPRGASPAPASFMGPGDMSMDVSRVDPEEALVDFQTLEPGDISGDIDESLLPTPEYGKEDKVLVSIRYHFVAIGSW